MTQVRLENVTKVFPTEGYLAGIKELGRALSGKELPGDKAGIKALDKVNLLIRHGETMSLIGPTACGKTTLLKVIAGLIAPDEGAVYFDGQDVTKMAPRERNITSVYTTHDQTEALALADRLAVMNEGRIEQVGTHTEVYNWPANVFVAGFVGTPAMNFFRGWVEDEGLRFVDFRLSFLPRLKTRLQPGQEVILGIRPEHIAIGAEGPLRARVEEVQPLVTERVQVIRTRLGGNTCVVRAGEEMSVWVGGQVSLCFDEERLHLFDAQTGSRLS